MIVPLLANNGDLVDFRSTDGGRTWGRATKAASGNAISAFAAGGIASGTQQFNEAMYEPSGGAPITGGSLQASPAGAHPGLVPAPPPAFTRTR